MAMVAWGLWAFFLRLAGSANYYLTAAASTTGGAVLMLIAFLIRPNWTFQWQAAVWGFVGGMAGTCGLFAYLAAAAVGKTSLAVTLSALYPVVTILLSFVILGERVTLVQWIGILLALIGIALIGWEGLTEG